MDAISREKEDDFRNMIRQDIKALPGAIKLIESLVKDKFKLALVSSAPRENIQLLLTGLNIDSYFDAIVCGEDVTEGKPSPQGFLLAAQKLGVEPENCTVIEDAVAGVAAAKRAGMHCLAVTNTHPRTSLKEADLIVDTLETVSVKDLDRLMSLS
jgi:beta-phosphoglucomutase